MHASAFLPLQVYADHQDPLIQDAARLCLTQMGEEGYAKPTVAENPSPNKKETANKQVPASRPASVQSVRQPKNATQQTVHNRGGKRDSNVAPADSDGGTEPQPNTPMAPPTPLHTSPQPAEGLSDPEEVHETPMDPPTPSEYDNKVAELLAEMRGTREEATAGVRDLHSMMSAMHGTREGTLQMQASHLKLQSSVEKLQWICAQMLAQTGGAHTGDAHTGGDAQTGEAQTAVSDGQIHHLLTALDMRDTRLWTCVACHIDEYAQRLRVE